MSLSFQNVGLVIGLDALDVGTWGISENDDEL